VELPLEKLPQGFSVNLNDDGKGIQLQLQ
jgi:hypothetical protein